MAVGLSSHLLSQWGTHLIPKRRGSVSVPMRTPFVGMLLLTWIFCGFLSVAHPQDPHHPAEKPVIHCHKCGEPCKGEVLRVQTKHFHIKCFTCKGMVCHNHSGMSQSVLSFGSAPSHNFTLGHWMVSECTQKPRSHLSSLIWDWIRLKGDTKSPQDQWCPGLWVFTEVPDPRRVY